MKAYIYKKTIIKTGKHYIGKHNGNNKYYKGSGNEYLIDYKLYVNNRNIDLLEEILEYVDDISKLNEREKYWLEYYDATNNPLYYNRSNLSHGVQITSLETKLKQSKSSPRRKKILQYDLNGNFIKEWDCMKDVERELNISTGDLTCCLKGKQLSAGKFQWRKWELNYPLIINSYIKPKRSLESKLKQSIKLKGKIKPKDFGKHRYKPILQLDKENNIINEFKSIRNASQLFDVNINKIESNICACLKNKQKTAYGYKWKYKTI